MYNGSSLELNKYFQSEIFKNKFLYGSQSAPTSNLNHPKNIKYIKIVATNNFITNLSNLD